jgi:hypothetical protein
VTPGPPAPLGAALQTIDPVAGVPLSGGPASEPAVGDPMASVGIALLAYALVQLLGRVIDRLPIGRPAGEGGHAAPPRTAADYGGEDRTRLARVDEILRIDHERIARMEETLREVQEHTRWLNEQRLTGRDGPFHCRAGLLGDEVATNRRLIGQALDVLREVQGQNSTLLRRLRALWSRMSRKPGGG